MFFGHILDREEFAGNKKNLWSFAGNEEEENLWSSYQVHLVLVMCCPGWGVPRPLPAGAYAQVLR